MDTSRDVLPSYSRCESRHCRPQKLYVNENNQGNAMQYMAVSYTLELQLDVRCASLTTLLDEDARSERVVRVTKIRSDGYIAVG